MSRSSLTLWFWVLDKPINNRVNIGGIFAWYHIAAHLSVCYRIQSPAQQTIVLKRVHIDINIYALPLTWFPILPYSKGKDTYSLNSTKTKLAHEILSAYISSVKACLDRAPGLSILFPNTSNGIPLNDVLFSRSWSSLLEMLRLSWSAASTT